jgi:hypothetical protein
MTSGRGATLTWTSYNYPASITNGTDTATFSYTPDRQYWKQVSNYTSGGTATTLYIGGLLEKVTTSTATDYRHYIRAGGSTIIVSRQSTGTNSLYYVTSDHLGSSSAITNSAGGIIVYESFRGGVISKIVEEGSRDMTVIEQEVLDIVRDVNDSGERLNNIADQFRSGRDVHEVLVLLNSSEYELVSVGAWILGELRIDLYNRDPFISRLTELVDHPLPAVRFHAFGALFPVLNWGDESARLLLAKLRNDPNEGVRKSAEAAAARVPSN